MTAKQVFKGGNMNLLIEKIDQISLKDIAELLEESIDEGFRHIERLMNEFESGLNRFDKPGETLYVAVLESRIVGVGGLNIDPYSNATVGRLRRLYVLKEYRGIGIGKKITETILGKAKNYYTTIVLKTDNPKASKFYIRLGFSKITDNDKVTHWIDL
jgi:GNAT superfamily N-acetyltransferase